MDKKKKSFTASKAVCIGIMIALIVIGFFLGGMSSLNARYERIHAYSTTSPELYNMSAARYNQQLEKFPTNLIKAVMPVKGPLEYDPNGAAGQGEGLLQYLPDSSALSYVGIAVVVLLAGGLIKLLY